MLFLLFSTFPLCRACAWIMGVVMVKKAVYRLSGYKVYLVKADSLADAFAIADEQGYVVFSGEYVTDSQAAKIIHEVAYNGTRAMVLQ